jgi:hypothetical protein
VGDADAEAERPHAPDVSHTIPELLKHETNARVIAGEDVAQFRGLITAASPSHPGEIDVIVDTEVVKGAEELAVQRLPESDLCRDSPVEPLEYASAVGSFGGRCEAEQFRWGETAKQFFVRARSRMMKFVDDHDLEMIGSNLVLELAQGLN